MSKDIVNYIKENQNEAGCRIAFEEAWKTVVTKLYGNIKYEANQAGVEFYKELTTDTIELGKAGDFIGWQCKWFESKKGTLESSHINQVKDSLKKTSKYLPEINKWYLCTPQTISLSSQSKIEELGKQFNIDVFFWDGETLDQKAYEVAPLVKESLSGKLTIDESSLEKLVLRKIKRADPNWESIPHVDFEDEKEIKRILGYEYNRIYSTYKGKIDDSLVKIKNNLNKRDSEYINRLIKLIEPLAGCGAWTNKVKLQEILQNTITNIEAHKLIVRYSKTTIKDEIITIVNSISSINSIIKKQISRLEVKSIGIIGDAGTGKTNLAISLVRGDNQRIPGILTFAKDLSNYDTVNSFFQKHVVLPNHKQIDSFSDLALALELIATKNNCRIPIVIDAINESKFSKRWKDLIDEITYILNDYDRIVLIYTSRKDIASDNVHKKFNTKNHAYENFSSLINAYFAYYKIIYTGPAYHTFQKDFPLSLRLLCEQTNPSRKNKVVIQSLRWDIAYRLHEKLKTIINNIITNNNNSEDITVEDLERVFIRVGSLLFGNNGQSTPKKVLLDSLQEACSYVSDKTLHLLESEGLIKINPNENDEYFVDITYQRFGGFLIAYFLTERNNISNFQDKKLLDKINSHTWHEDIWLSLTCLFQMKHKIHLFDHVPETYKDTIFDNIAKIPQEFLCEEHDVETIHKHFSKMDLDKVLEKTMEAWLEPYHPCNFCFIDRLLQHQSSRDLNLKWCEYIRKNDKFFTKTLNRIEMFTDEAPIRFLEMIKLFLIWIQASTSPKLRAKSHMLLLKMAQNNPVKFINEIQKYFNSNDYQLIENLLFCAYSAALSKNESENLADAIDTLISKAEKTFFNKNNKNYTTDILLWKALKLFNDKYTSIEGKALEFSAPKPSIWPFGSSNNQDLNMAFLQENSHCKFTTLDLIELEFQERPLAKLLSRVVDFGWSQDAFDDIDNEIRSQSIRNPENAYETYFHKFFTLAEKEFIGIHTDVDIHPTDPRPYVKPPERIPLSNHFLIETKFLNSDWYNGIIKMDVQRIKSGLIKQLEDVVDPNEWELIHAKFHDQSFRQNKFLCIHFKSFLVTRKQQQCDCEDGYWHYPSVGNKYLYEGPDISINLNDEIRHPFIFDFEPIGEKQLVLLDSTLTKTNNWKFNFENYCYYRNDEQMTKYIFTTQQNALYACEFLFIRRNWLTNLLNKEGLFLLHSCLVENNKYPNVRDEWRSVVHFSI